MMWSYYAWVSAQECEGMGGKCLLFALGRYVDKQGRCFPSQATLAKDAHMSERSVRTWLARLEELGLIRRYRGEVRRGRHSVDHYQLLNKDHEDAEEGFEEGEIEAPEPTASDANDDLTIGNLRQDHLQEVLNEVVTTGNSSTDHRQLTSIPLENVANSTGNSRQNHRQMMQNEGGTTGNSCSDHRQLTSLPPANGAVPYKEGTTNELPIELKPLNPLSSQDEGDEEDELWERFRLTWVLHPADSFAKARREWDGLSIGDQSLAVEHAKGYQLAAKGQNYPISAKRYLADQLWQGQAQKLAQSQARQSDPALPPRVFVIKDSEAWWAWAAHDGRSYHAVTNTTTYLVGWWFPSTYPPGYVIGTFDEKGKRTGTEG